MGAVTSQEQWAPPSIRPPVASPLSPGQPGGGRRNAGGQGSLEGDGLGIEESEYDTPAYLRRSRGAAQASGPSGHDYAAMGYRMPADKYPASLTAARS